jgi:protein-L-isoaspartate(D-aspartate) O-methyltransferase
MQRSSLRGTQEALVQTLQAHGIRSARVLDAFQCVRREGFVPPQWREVAYVDRPIPIPHGQVTTQPSLIARMVTALHLRGTERVLEIGTGLGFQTALLAVLAREVFSIERFGDLAEQARANLQAAGLTRMTIVVGDGSLGLPNHAPYAGIVVSAAAPQVPPPLCEQLLEGGRLVQPLGPGGQERVIVFRKEQHRLVQEAEVTPACFVPLVGAYGLPGEPGG